MNSEKIAPILKNIYTQFSISQEYSIAIFSAGCFWCVEGDFKKLDGVEDVISGYTSNNSNDTQPTYEEVCSGTTNFRESVLVIFNSQKISYSELVQHFLTIHDPTDIGGSFYDRGFQYTSAIYYISDEQKLEAQEEISKYNSLKIYENLIITSVEKVCNFFKAEEYHQEYSRKCPIRYKLYRKGSGRDSFISQVSKKINSR